MPDDVNAMPGMENEDKAPVADVAPEADPAEDMEEGDKPVTQADPAEEGDAPTL